MSCKCSLAILCSQFVGDRGVRTLTDAEEYVCERALKVYATPGSEGMGPGGVVVKADTAAGTPGTVIGLCGLFKAR